MIKVDERLNLSDVRERVINVCGYTRDLGPFDAMMAVAYSDVYNKLRIDTENIFERAVSAKYGGLTITLNGLKR
jgi:hypothetical protein